MEVAKFPWGASGRALTLDRPDGLTKLIIDPKTERVLGVGIVGHGAGELIAEGVVAMEMGATVRDLALCVHPHPTLSETIMEAAEVFLRPGHAHAFQETRGIRRGRWLGGSMLLGIGPRIWYSGNYITRTPVGLIRST